MFSDASIGVRMKIPMPAAVLAGGASRRMGAPKAALPYGTTTLLAHQTSRLARLFEEVIVAVKETPGFDCGPARIVVDSFSERAPLYGLLRALEETEDRLFVLAVDLPLLAQDVIGAIAGRGLVTAAPAVVPQAAGLLQPLAAVWRRSVLPTAHARMRRGEMSLHGLAQAVGAEIFGEQAWRALDPSGNSFANVNTVEEYVAARERA
jgi:molybdopterin-guanine dinucleotide biosynthesis protein A